MKLQHIDDWQGQPGISVKTALATYILQTTGGGLASIIDPDGKDWLSYKPVEPGETGKHRGFPNMVYQRCGGDDYFFHPGNVNESSCETTIIAQSPEKIAVQSTSVCGKWKIQWDFFATHLNVTVVKAPDAYWILYEGTPGGHETAEQVQWTHGAAEQWFAAEHKLSPNLTSLKQAWMAFTSLSSPYSLAVSSRTIAPLALEYWWMGHEQLKRGMTVAGFGREGIQSLLRGEGAVFSLYMSCEKQHAPLAHRLQSLCL